MYNSQASSLGGGDIHRSVVKCCRDRFMWFRKFASGTVRLRCRRLDRVHFGGHVRHLRLSPGRLRENVQNHFQGSLRSNSPHGSAYSSHATRLLRYGVLEWSPTKVCEAFVAAAPLYREKKMSVCLSLSPAFRLSLVFSLSLILLVLFLLPLGIVVS